MSDDTEKSEGGATVEAEGYESHNNSREETQAIMEADSPDDIDKDLLERIEKERQERLDPDNRPENAEVDNTQRTFIAEEARFEDSEIDGDDGIGQKEPDPEATSGSSDDESHDDGDDAEDEATEQEAESDASTGPAPQDEAEKDEADKKPGRHKA